MAVYRCRRCGYEADASWNEECPACRGFYRCIKIGVDTADQKMRSTFAAAAESKTVYIPTGVAGFDKVIGGGLVAGSPILLGGERGTGKSTLLCMVADAVAKVKGRALYASSEQDVNGVLAIAHRSGTMSADVEVLGSQQNVERVIQHAKQTKPFLTIFDSLQKFSSDASGGSPGSIAQGEAVSAAILDHCRSTKTCAIIINQMDKAGTMKGSTDAAHSVDTVIVLGYPLDDDEEAPGDSKKHRVLLVAGKNRNGAENSKSYWYMHGDDDTHPGMLECVPPKSKLIVDGSRKRYRKLRAVDDEDGDDAN